LDAAPAAAAPASPQLAVPPPNNGGVGVGQRVMMMGRMHMEMILWVGPVVSVTLLEFASVQQIVTIGVIIGGTGSSQVFGVQPNSVYNSHGLRGPRED
jgi:hypothetical protein